MAMAVAPACWWFLVRRAALITDRHPQAERNGGTVPFIQPPLTDAEVESQRWLSSISWQLPPERWDDVWKVGGRQFGVSSIRYQAAFAGYAAAALGQRTPAYPALTARILENLIERMLDRRTWSYAAQYWKQPGGIADPCARENIMYTGHLLQLMAFYEALSGDDRFRTRGFDFAGQEGQRVHYDLMKLVDVTVRQMRANSCGGVSCEPGLVFFPCNNHPHVALRLLEGMGLGDWSAERKKWEDWALGSYRASVGGGLLRLFYHESSRTFAPLTHGGLDAWSALWYAPWASSESDARALWAEVRRRIRWEEFEGAADPQSKDGGGLCCGVLTVPLPAVASMYAAAARMNGDAQTAGFFEGWLDERFERIEDGRRYLAVSAEWRTGVTANRTLARALGAGSDLRRLVQSPPPRESFRGPLVRAVRPDSVVVREAAFCEGVLYVQFEGGGRDVELELENVPIIREGVVKGADGWRHEGGVLRISRAGRLRLAIDCRQGRLWVADGVAAHPLR